MLDVDKLIQAVGIVSYASSFSSMLDVGKLIRHSKLPMRQISFSSMLDIGKLIRKYPIGYWLDSGGDAIEFAVIKNKEESFFCWLVVLAPLIWRRRTLLVWLTRM